MNHNSFICCYINEHENWEEELKEKHIGISKEGNLAVFKYMVNADFSDPYVQEARGIIIDLTTLDVVCWPFRKFGNWNESYADEIDWGTAKVQEKVDGSLMKLYFYNNEWVWATNSTIRIDNVSNPEGIAFSSLLHRAENYKDINYELLDKECTYLFELVSPDNQIVLTYSKTMLYHIGTRNNATGIESNPDIGIQKPKQYGGQKDLKYWLTTVEGKRNATNPQMEGYVVVDKDYHRIKIKTPEIWIVTDFAIKILVGFVIFHCFAMVNRKDWRAVDVATTDTVTFYVVRATATTFRNSLVVVLYFDRGDNLARSGVHDIRIDEIVSFHHFLCGLNRGEDVAINTTC